MSDTEKSVDKAMQRRGRLIALGLMLVVALPMVAAYIIYHTGMGMPTGTINKGDFLHPPQPVARLQLQTPEGDTWQADAEDERWRLVVPVTAECDQACRDKLYVTRQVHVRLGKDAYRVQRLVVLVDSELTQGLQNWLEEEHPGVVVLHNSAADWRAMLAPTNLEDSDPLAGGHYYLMDPQGYLMMSYRPEHTGGELLDDVKRMLKLSYEDR